MSDREELMAWGQTMVLCDCHEAYTLRGLEAPDCLWHQGAGPVLDELLDSGWLREVRAKAWDEGRKEGWLDRRVEGGPAVNPYRHEVYRA